MIERHTAVKPPSSGSPSFLPTNRTGHATTTGWLSSTRSKALLHDAAADAFRNKETVLDWFETITQVVSREESTVCSSEGIPITKRITAHWRQAAVNSNPFGSLPRRKTCPPAGQLPDRDGGKGRTGSGKAADRDARDAASDSGSEHIPLTKITVHDSNTRKLPSARDKPLLYDAAADGFRGKDTVLDWFAAITQVGSREGSTVSSLEGMPMTGWITTPWRQAAVNSIPLSSLASRKTCPPSGQLPGRDGGKGCTGSAKGPARDGRDTASNSGDP